MVLIVNAKLHYDLMVLHETDSKQLFAHHMNEILAFDAELVSKFGYPPNPLTSMAVPVALYAHPCNTIGSLSRAPITGRGLHIVTAMDRFWHFGVLNILRIHQ